MKTVKEILVDARKHLATVGLHHGDFFKLKGPDVCREGPCCALGAIRVGAEEAPSTKEYPPQLLRLPHAWACPAVQGSQYNDMVRAANLVGKATGTRERFGSYSPIRYDIPRWNDEADLPTVLAAFDAAIAAAPED